MLVEHVVHVVVHDSADVDAVVGNASVIDVADVIDVVDVDACIFATACCCKHNSVAYDDGMMMW